MVLYIYKENGDIFEGLALHKAAFESVVMSLSDKITGEVLYKNNQLPYTMKEYVVYNNTKYYLKNPPAIVRNGMSDSSEKGFTKYSFEFYHPSMQLFSIPFTDVAVTNTELQYKAEDKTFQWIGTLRDFCAKVNKNLEHTIFTCDYAYYDDGTTADNGDMSEVLSFDNVMISDALKTCYETFKTPFVLEDILPTDSDSQGGKKKYRIRFGKPSREVLDKNNKPFVFKFGQGLGLKNNSATPKNNKIITRIAGQGSETNIPWGYPQIEWTGDQSWDYTINNDPKAKGSYPIYNGIVNGKAKRLIKHPFTRKRLMPSIYRETVRQKIFNPSVTLIDYYDADDSSYTNRINPLAPSYEHHLFEGIKPSIKGIKYDNHPIDEFAADAFPIDKNGDKEDAWNDKTDEEGNYEQSYFKVTLPSLGFDLYALAIENQPMTIAVESGECNGCKFEIQVNWEDWKNNFYIKNDKDELIFDDGTATDAEGNVYIPEGSHRDAVKYPLSINQSITVIVKKDIETFGTIYPNVYQQPKKSDKYVFLGISLPLFYITSKERELDEKMKEYMRENNVYYFEYPLKFDEFFLEQHQDILSQIRTNSLIRFEFAKQKLALSVKQITIKYGEKPLPEYDITLTDDISIVLNSIGQITEGLSRLGTKVSAIQAYYNKSIFKDMFDKLNTKLSKQSDDIAHGEISFDKWMKVKSKPIYDYFLRKDQSDGTSFLTKFAGGVNTADIKSIDANGRVTYKHGMLDGRGYSLYTDGSGDTFLEVDTITARKKFVATVLDIQKETFSAGNTNLNNANGTIFRVYAFDDSGYNSISVFAAPNEKGEMVTIALMDAKSQKLLGNVSTNPILRRESLFKIYFTRDDGTDKIEDLWHNGDMALAKTLNLVGNEEKIEKNQRAWHRVVTSHGVDVLEDGKEYNYIVVSNSSALINVKSEDGTIVTGVKAYDSTLPNSKPIIGDKVVQYGSVTEVKRMGLTSLRADGDGNGGIYVVEGVGKKIGSNEQFQPTLEPIKITPNDTTIIADRIKIATRNAANEIIGSKDFDVNSYKLLISTYSNSLNADGTCTTRFTFSINKNNSKSSKVLTVGEINSEGFVLQAQKNTDSNWDGIDLSGLESGETKISKSYKYKYLNIQNAPSSFTLRITKEGSVIDEYAIPIIVNGTNGKDGTSVSIKGTAIGIYNTFADFEADSKKEAGTYLIKKKEQDNTFHWVVIWSGTSITEQKQATLGDGYIDTNGDMWIAVDNGWKNVGRIQGKDGIDGENGEDAVLVVFKPSSLILTEKKKNAEYDGLNTPIAVYTRIGDVETAATISKISIPEKDFVANLYGNVFSITKVGDDITSGYLLVHVSYKNTEIVQRFDVYINRLGSWSLNVQNDTMKALAGNNFYEEQPDGTISVTKNMSEIYQNSEGIRTEVSKVSEKVTAQGTQIAANTSSITQQSSKIENVVSRTEGLEKATSEIKQTADNISLKVNNEGGLNLMEGTKLLSNEHIFLYPEGDSVAQYKEGFVTIGTTLPASSPLNYVNLLEYSKILLKYNTVYTLSFMYIGSSGSSFETYTYGDSSTRELTRVCKYVKSNFDLISRTDVDGHCHFKISNGKWNRGSIEFCTVEKTQEDVSDFLEAIIIIGRLFKQAAIGNNIYISAPKLEYGNVATEWRPNEKDTESNLAATGIDIENRKITLTADKVEFKDNNGNTNAVFVDNKLNVNLINANQVVTDGLKAGRVVADKLELSGNSKFGVFSIYTGADGRQGFENAQVLSSDAHIKMTPYALTYDFYDTTIIPKILNKSIAVGSFLPLSGTLDRGMEIKMDNDNIGKTLQGIYIDVKPKEDVELKNDIYNDAIHIEHGSFCGFRPRLRRVLITTPTQIEVKKEDYTILVSGEAEAVLRLPTEDVEDGQRFEIRLCSDIKLTLANKASNTTRFKLNEMRIYIYDKIADMWWVNILNG